MNWWELNNVLEAIFENNKDSAENNRLLMYSIFQSQSSKKIKPEDIIKFSWDEKEVEIDKNKYITKDDALEIIKRINNGKETIFCTDRVNSKD